MIDVNEYTDDDMAHAEKMLDAADQIGDILKGMSLMHAAFVIGRLIADQVDSVDEAQELNGLILEATLSCIKGDAEEVANTLPV